MNTSRIFKQSLIRRQLQIHHLKRDANKTRFYRSHVKNNVCTVATETAEV